MKINLTKANFFLKCFALTKVPLILFTGVSIVEISDQRTVVKIPLNWRTKNHLKSMYFGALSVGADVAAGLYASLLIQESKLKIQLSFKDFKANFLKRPTADVYFVVDNAQQIMKFVSDIAKNPGIRKNLTVPVYAATNHRDVANSLVAEFALTLSLKLSPKN